MDISTLIGFVVTFGLILASLMLTTLSAAPAAAKGGLEKWQKKLELTDEQSAKLKTLKEEHKAALEPLRNEGKEHVKALRKLLEDPKASDKDISAALEKLQKNHEAVHAERKRFMEKAKGVLTPRQQAKAALMLMKKGRMHGRWGKGAKERE